MSMVLETGRIQAFAERTLGTVNGGFLSLMLSVGHRTGLLDSLAALPPSTSDQIAAASGLNERYVREWLGAMAAGRIVEFDPAARTYWLPREHAAVLTRAAGPDNLRDALRPEGVFLMVDIATSSHLERDLDNPMAPFLYTVSTMHCMTVSLAQGGEGLGACWGEEKARELLAEAGFRSIGSRPSRAIRSTCITSAGEVDQFSARR